jgi:ankyrin repeat protein
LIIPSLPFFPSQIKALKEANPKDEKIKQLSLYSDVNHQDKEGKTPLQIAIEKKNLCLLEVCVCTRERRCSQYHRQPPPPAFFLTLAPSIPSARFQILFDLGKDGPDSLLINQVGWTAMHTAVHSDDLEMLKKFVGFIGPARTKALLKTADKTGREPLHIAAYKCTEEMVAYLIERGASAKSSDSAGNTASKLADKSNRRRSKEILENAEGAQAAPKGRRKSRDSREYASRESKESMGGDSSAAPAGA